MISNKTLATIFLITLNMQLVTSTSPSGTKRPRSPVKSTLTKRQKRPSGAKGTVLMLRDTTNTVDPVEVQDGSTGVISTSQKLSVSQVNNQFGELIEKGEYNKIFELGEKMNDEEFLGQLYPVIDTLDQYNGVVKYLKYRKMVASFYAYGNIEVIKGVIIESKVYDNNYYVDGGVLETALTLVLKEDRHNRVMELLDVRKGMTSEKDGRRRLEGKMTSFEWFVDHFLENLAPWKDGMALRRFLIFRGEELRSKYRDILDTLCEKLMTCLRIRLDFPFAKQLLADLIGQPSLSTFVVFVNAFLYFNDDEDRSNFIKYGYREAILVGLKKECWNAGKKLWQAMQTKRPDQFPGEFPVTEEARIAACMHIPTKRQKEAEWIKKNAAILYVMFKGESTSSILPDVLWSIIFEYAVMLVVTLDLTTSTE